MRLAYLVTHPIQYHVPMLREISNDPDIDLTVFYCSTLGASSFHDPEFGQTIDWGRDLLSGYDYEVLPAIGGSERVGSFIPFSYGLFSRLRRGKFDVLWIHGYARPFNILAAIQAKMLGIKVFLRDDATLVSRKRSGLKVSLKKLFFNFLNIFIDKFLSVGSYNSKYYRAQGIPEEKISLIPYVVDNRYFKGEAIKASETRDELRKELKLDPKRPIILFVGKLIEEKAPLDLFTAYQKLVSSHDLVELPYLLYVGDGVLRGDLERAINDSNLSDSARIIGFVDQANLPRYYDLCDLLVLPSVSETWGLVVNEVMNASKPVILSSSVGASGDLIKDDLNGYVFPSGDCSELANKLSNILSVSGKSKLMGDESLKIIEQHDYRTTIARVKNSLSEVVRSEGVV